MLSNTIMDLVVRNGLMVDLKGKFSKKGENLFVEVFGSGSNVCIIKGQDGDLSACILK